MPKLSVAKKQLIDTEIKDKVYKEALTLLRKMMPNYSLWLSWPTG